MSERLFLFGLKLFEMVCCDLIDFENSPFTCVAKFAAKQVHHFQNLVHFTLLTSRFFQTNYRVSLRNSDIVARRFHFDISIRINRAFSPGFFLWYGDGFVVAFDADGIFFIGIFKGYQSRTSIICNITISVFLNLTVTILYRFLRGISAVNFSIIVGNVF